MKPSIIASVFASTLIALASAYTTPVGTPQGNPISSPGLKELVPKGAPYKIKWNPTDKDHTVSLILLRGPAENCVPLHPIVEKTPNTGEYEWTPKSDLEADDSRYGIQLIDDKTGFFQYSTQFGIKEGAHDNNKKQATTLTTSTVKPVQTGTDESTDESTGGSTDESTGGSTEDGYEDYIGCGPDDVNYLGFCE